MIDAVERNPIYVIAENVRSLFNVGAIFRAADGVKARKVFLTGFTGHPPQREIEKVALGADRAVPWAYAPESGEVIAQLRRQGIGVVALEWTDRSVDFHNFDFSFPVAVVVGHEVVGVAEETRSLCDACVHIPMYGEKRSLNVSVACGVLLYEVMRRLRAHRGF